MYFNQLRDVDQILFHSMLGHCRRWWIIIETPLCQCLIFAGLLHRRREIMHQILNSKIQSFLVLSSHFCSQILILVTKLCVFQSDLKPKLVNIKKVSTTHRNGRVHFKIILGLHHSNDDVMIMMMTTMKMQKLIDNLIVLGVIWRFYGTVSLDRLIA